MRKGVFLAVIIGISVVGVGCETGPRKAATETKPVVASTAPAPLKGTSATVLVHGLACPSCAQGVERQLRQTVGVTGVTMDVVTGMVQVTWKPGAVITEKDLRDAVRWGGGVYVKLIQP